VWFIVTFFIGLGACVSCRSDRQSDTFLERHSQELVDLTVPIDSSSIVRSSVQRTTWGGKGFLGVRHKDEPRGIYGLGQRKTKGPIPRGEQYRLATEFLSKLG
jgi:hypothetical protein